MSNIRQRRGPSPSRDSYGTSSTSWEIATDDSGANAHAHAHAHAHASAKNVVPMYNPTNIQPSLSKPDTSPSSLPSTTSKMLMSHHVSWNTIMDAKKANSDFLRDNSLANTYHDQPGYYTGATAGKGGEYKLLQSGRSLPSMSPALVPDSAYRAYLSGRPAEKQKNTGLDKIQIATFFGYFSLVGFIFLTFIGILIDTQPMFLQGILPKNEGYSSGGKSVKISYATEINDRLEPATHAYRGAFLYLLTAIVCLGYAYNIQWFWFKKGRQQYRDIDNDAESTVPTFHHSSSSSCGLGANDDFLPNNGAIHRQAYGDHNGFIMRTWYSTSVKLQRLGIYLESIWQARSRNRRRFADAKDV